MNTIYRYNAPVDDAPVIKMQKGARVLSVAPARNGTRFLDIWAVVDPNAPLVDRMFHIVGAGHPVSHDVGELIGRVSFYEGSVIFHVFESISVNGVE